MEIGCTKKVHHTGCPPRSCPAHVLPTPPTHSMLISSRMLSGVHPACRPYTALVATIMDLCKEYLHHPGSHTSTQPRLMPVTSCKTK
jgi:hypothetical protein